MSTLASYFEALTDRQPWRWQGRIVESVGQTVESVGPPASVGECCELIDQRGRIHPAEVIGVRGANVLSMPVETTGGLRFGDSVRAQGAQPSWPVGEALLGRVLDAQ